MAEQKAKLVARRAAVKRNLTRLEDWIRENTDPQIVSEHSDSYEVEARVKSLGRILDAYDLIQNELEALDEKEADRNEFEKRIEKADALLHRLKSEASVSQIHDMINQSLLHASPNVNVTVDNQNEMNIPKPKPFNGEDYKDWPTFYNSFNTLIHESTSSRLNPTKKFSILRDCVTGRAYDAIKHLPLTEDGYIQAMDILKKRYDKKRLLFESLIQDLLQIPSAENEKALRGVYDKSTALTQALEALPATREQIGYGILIQTLLAKVDKVTLNKWEEKGAGSSELATWEEFVEFLDGRCDIIESISFSHKNQVSSSSKAYKTTEVGTKPKSKAYLVDTGNRVAVECICCRGNCTELSKCDNFLSYTPRERYNFAKRNQKCVRCLISQSHAFRDCHYRCTAAGCNGKHNILLHDDDWKLIKNKSSPIQKTENVNNTPDEKREYNNNSSKLDISPDFSPSPVKAEAENNPVAMKVANKSATINNKKQSLLATALVRIKSSEGEYFVARALLDSGSMVNFVTRRFAGMLKLKFVQQITDMKGMFSQQKLTHVTSMKIMSRSTEYNNQIEAVILPTFDDCHPCIKINEEQCCIPENIKENLADPQFYLPQNVDLILGVGVAHDILSVGHVKLNNGLHVQKTLLGWIVAGEIAMTGKPKINNSSFLASLTEAESDELKKFWELEEARQPLHVLSQEEVYCEKFFVESVARNEEGRFVVKIPFKDDPAVLGESRSAALSYLRSIERKLSREPVLKQMYEDFLIEYEGLGHMTRVPEEEISKHPDDYNIIPHHFVLKWESSSTKLRVVFHASFPTSTGHSFNSIQCVGPTLQPNLFDILLRARLAPILICADVAKMYRQILVSPEQQRHQCILWRLLDGRIATFKLNTITYGTASASFNAVRCLIELAKLYPESSLATKVILNSMYIDDIIAGASDVQEGKRLIRELTELMSLGCFPLRKWCSNSKHVMSEIPEEHREPLVSMGDEATTKTLGLQWNPETDVFMFNYQPDTEVKSWTKRKIISTVSKLFDPLGLVGPVVCKAKMLCQHLWKLGLHWDESIDQSTLQQWLKLISEMDDLKSLRFPRFVLGMKNAIRIELHCFADASTKAYGAVFYIKCVDARGQCTVILLCSKSKVAPVKTVSLPRLELCGALLLADLFTTVTNVVKITFDKIYCWLDSKIALRWVTASPHLWNDFVAARTTKIQQQVLNAEWRHVPGDQNPADILSRGASPKSLMESASWFDGPAFLKNDESSWNFALPELPSYDDEIMEAKHQTFALTARIDTDLIMQLKSVKYLSRVRDIFAYIHRFINGCKGNVDKSPLTVIDQENGLKLAVKTVQIAYFQEQRDLLLKGKPLRVSDPLNKLAIFLDEDGLIRVGGRLKNVPHYTYDEKYPMLLPKRHPLVQAIFYHYHVLNLHPGPLSLVAMVRSRYWPLSGRVVAKQVYGSCRICSIAKPMLFKQVMGNLPKERVSFNRPFETVGVDLFGPFTVINAGRGSRRSQMYAAIFICFATKAVHIEYVIDTATKSFINALQRFIYVRAIPAHIWSDNATNFIGANEVMKHIDWKQVDFWSREYKSIQWHFIPPRSPHFGGLWESGVKLAKTAMLKILNENPIHFDAFYTLLKAVEGNLNSRPLTPLSSNPNDPRPLAPADVITGTPMTTLPEPTVQNFPSRKGNLVKHWQQLNEILNHWKKRWSTELLQSYQVRGKWFVGSPEITVDRLVYMPDPGANQLCWIMAKIEELHPGNDGKTRVVTVVTPNGTKYKRSVIQLAPVPLQNDDE